MSTTQKKLAAMLGITPGRVSQLVFAGTIPQGAPLAEQVAAHCENLRAVAAGRTDAPELSAERARLVRVQADVEELRLAELKGELIRTNVVKPGMAVVFATTRDRLMQLPARQAQTFASETSPTKVHELLTDEIHHALSQLADAPMRLGASGE